MQKKRNNAGLCIVLNGRVPSKKNSRNIFTRYGRTMNIPSKKYKEWHINASLQLTDIPREKLKNVIVSLTFFAPDLRIADLTNKTESIMDLLVDNEILLDDNWFYVGNISMRLAGVDRKQPRCIITIEKK